VVLSPDEVKRILGHRGIEWVIFGTDRATSPCLT
jgi:hypothetical protein